MTISGGCYCGAVRYELTGDPLTHALCHCSDCRRHAGAPVVSWMMFPEAAVRITRGTPKVHASSATGRRHFCADCGTGVFYVNPAQLPGIIDVQSATCDDPTVIPPPRVHVQTAERLPWMTRLQDLPEFERFPPQA